MPVTMPTAAQIEAPVANPTFTVELLIGGSWIERTADVLDISTAIETTSGSDGIGFGVGFAPSAEIRVAPEAFNVAWDRTPVRIAYGYNNNNPYHFVGLIDGLADSDDEATWQARGYDALLEGKEIRSPLYYRRPVATQTTTTSVEDPASPAYRGGLVNYIFWKAGGRPWAQITAYPSAPFYYDCEGAILAPEWTWINGGNALQVLLDLCSAAGGLIYQDTSGIVRYVEPYSFANKAPSFHYTDTPLDAAQRIAQNAGDYGSFSRSATHALTVDRVRCNFVARRLQGVREVYSDRTPRQLDPGQSISLPLDLTLPCYRIDSIVANAGTIHTARTVTPAQLTITRTATYAQRVEITLTNTLGEAIAIYDLKVLAQPLMAMEEGSATYGAAPGEYGRELAIPDSPFIQSRVFAERLCWLYYDFYRLRRDIVTLGGCGFDPRRAIGELVTLTNSRRAISALAHRICAIRVARTGIEMELDVVPVAGLPVGADFFQLGGVYSDAQEFELAP